jgi:hypothetical protein
MPPAHCDPSQAPQDVARVSNAWQAVTQFNECALGPCCHLWGKPFFFQGKLSYDGNIMAMLAALPVLGRGQE